MSQKMEKQFEQRLAALSDLLKQPENKECADCGSKGPKWASWSLGVFLCINCAGIHRSLGTHITKVKSATLDKWTEEQLDNMRNMGNGRAKLIYEATVPAGYPRPREGAPSHTLESWIRAKYDKKQFMERGRTANKEKREEPYQYKTPSERTGSRSKPAPPSPRQHSRQQKPAQQQQTQAQAQPSRPLISMDGPATSQPASFAAASNQGIDLFNLLGGSAPQQQQQQQQQHQHQQHQQQQQHQQHQQQQQQQQQQQGGHDMSFFASLDGGQAQQQQKTLDKNSIMSLYHQPIAPTMPMGMMPHQMAATGQQQRAPNYNIHLMPATNMFIGPGGVPMMMGPTGMVPVTGYPAGWAGQAGQMGAPQQQQVQVGVGMTPYGYTQY